MTRDAPLGIFDSGFGGLTVARSVIDQLPHESVVYVGDTARQPYGPKPIGEVREYALECLDHLVAQGVKALVIACNSASAAMLRDARERYDVPVVEVIFPATRRAVQATRNGRIGVICTRATAESMAYDDASNLLYIGTGNGAPWSRDIRSPGGGDNLYLSSILALNADDGEMVWYYQTTPGDDWDYTATQPLMLLDLTIDGRERQVIVQAPKNGFFYVVDRLTGELLSAETFGDDVTWATEIDPESGRPVETAEARYGMNRRGAYLSPGPTGSHNWRPMSWNAETGLVYLPAQNTQSYYEMADSLVYTQGRWNTGTTIRGGGTPRAERGERPELTGPRTMLLAWDPVTNSEVWRATGKGGNGGTLSTAGNLVFWGTGNVMVAYDAQSGEELWSAEVGRNTATPATYVLDGRQYITIAGGSGGRNDAPRVTTFTLDALSAADPGN